MSPSLVRNSLRRTACTRRWSSTKASSSTLPKTTPSSEPSLPDEKMRALVELYHKSQFFITPETLERAIDFAFIDNTASITNSLSTQDSSYTDLKAQMHERRLLPKLGSTMTPTTQRSKDITLQFSEISTRREAMVIEALFGARRAAPGLAALQEEATRVKEHRKQDRNS